MNDSFLLLSTKSKSVYTLTPLHHLIPTALFLKEVRLSSFYMNLERVRGGTCAVKTSLLRFELTN